MHSLPYAGKVFGNPVISWKPQALLGAQVVSCNGGLWGRFFSGMGHKVASFEVEFPTDEKCPSTRYVWAQRAIPPVD